MWPVFSPPRWCGRPARRPPALPSADGEANHVWFPPSNLPATCPNMPGAQSPGARAATRKLSSRFARVRVRPGQRNAGTADRPEEWLLIEWPEGETAPTKYWLSTLPEDHFVSCTGRLCQTALAHRTRLSGPQTGGRARTFRGPRLARLPSPRHTVHRGLRLLDLRTGEDSPSGSWPTSCWKNLHPAAITASGGAGVGTVAFFATPLRPKKKKNIYLVKFGVCSRVGGRPAGELCAAMIIHSLPPPHGAAFRRRSGSPRASAARKSGWIIVYRSFEAGRYTASLPVQPAAQRLRGHRWRARIAGVPWRARMPAAPPIGSSITESNSSLDTSAQGAAVRFTCGSLGVGQLGCTERDILRCRLGCRGTGAEQARTRRLARPSALRRRR